MKIINGCTPISVAAIAVWQAMHKFQKPLIEIQNVPLAIKMLTYR